HANDEDTSVPSALASNGHHWGTDPEFNSASIRQDHPSEHPADPGRGQGDGIESVSPKFADDGSAHPGKVPHDQPTPTALSSDLSGDASAHPSKTNLDHHAGADPEINDVADYHPLQQPADNSLHAPAQHDNNGSPAVTNGAHPADQVDGKQ